MNRKFACLRATLYAIALVTNQCALLGANFTTLSVRMVPNASATTLVPSVSVTGERGIYTLQYASGLGGGQSNWGTLTNLTLSDAMTNWLDYSGVGQSQRFYRTVTARVDMGIFVDSVSGNDSNTGMSNSPFATLAKVTQTLGANSITATNIWLKRNSTWYESFAIPTNSTIKAYGIGSKPVISGASNLANANFTLTAGKTNTYQIALNVPVETNIYAGISHSNVLMVWDNNIRMGAKWDKNTSYSSNPTNAINSLDTNGLAFYYWTKNQILYICSGTNGSPVTNGHFYQASIRTTALCGGDNFLVEDVRAEKAYNYNSGGQQGYAILGNGFGTYRRCQGGMSWNHAVGYANTNKVNGVAVFDSCYIFDCELQNVNAPTLAIGYGDYDTNFTILRTNCVAYQPTTNLAVHTFGFYGHNSGHGGASNVIANCVAANVYYGYGIGPDMSVIKNSTNYNCYIGISVGNPSALNNVVISSNTSYNPVAAGVSIGSGCTNVAILNSKFYATNSATNAGTIMVYAGNTSVSITNCIFAFSTNITSTKGVMYAGTPSGWTLVSNSFYRCYNAIDYGILTKCDYNNYWQWGNRIASDMTTPPKPGYWTTLSAFKSANSPNDANSTNIDPNYSTNLFNFTVYDPSGN